MHNFVEAVDLQSLAKLQHSFINLDIDD